MFSDPKKNLEHLHFPASGTVIDAGAGSGHYTFLLAERLRELHGKVIAVDVQKEVLAKIKTEAIRRNVSNIECLWGDVEEMRGTGLPDAVADAAVVSNLLFQLSERDVFAQEFFRILKKGGEVLVIDWEPQKSDFGSGGKVALSKSGARGQEEVGLQKVATSNAEKLFERHGFTTTDRFRAGDQHWGRIFKKELGNESR